MKRGKSVLVRAVGLGLVAAVGGFLIFIPLAGKREERRVKNMLLVVQSALQEFHVAEEIYPRDPMTGAGLVHFLSKSGFLAEPPHNPWTQQPYGSRGERDGLRYRTDDLAETYELIVFEPGTEVEKFRLDSTENQSLE